MSLPSNWLQRRLSTTTHFGNWGNIMRLQIFLTSSLPPRGITAFTLACNLKVCLPGRVFTVRAFECVQQIYTELGFVRGAPLYFCLNASSKSIQNLGLWGVRPFGIKIPEGKHGVIGSRTSWVGWGSLLGAVGKPRATPFPKRLYRLQSLYRDYTETIQSL